MHKMWKRKVSNSSHDTVHTSSPSKKNVHCLNVDDSSDANQRHQKSQHSFGENRFIVNDFGFPQPVNTKRCAHKRIFQCGGDRHNLIGMKHTVVMFVNHVIIIL